MLLEKTEVYVDSKGGLHKTKDELFKAEVFLWFYSKAPDAYYGGSLKGGLYKAAEILSKDPQHFFNLWRSIYGSESIPDL